MSSILEALKKLEDEKAAKQSGAGHIVGKVVKSGRRSKQQRKWVLPAATALMTAAVMLGIYLFLGDRTTPRETLPTAPAMPDIQNPSKPRNPPFSEPALTPVPSFTPPAVRKAVPTKTARPVTERKPPVAATSNRQPPVVSPPAELPALPPKAEAKPSQPSLKVTGIGWQKDSSDRMAIVNGRPLGVGSVIEGARVEDILPDRVRFSIEDKIIEIPMGRSSGENP